MLLSGN